MFQRQRDKEEGTDKTGNVTTEKEKWREPETIKNGSRERQT